MSKIRIPAIIILVCSILFSLLAINFSFDISLLAFPVSASGTAFLSYFLYIKLFKRKEFGAVKVSLKLLQYIPFIHLLSFILRRAGKKETVYAYDVITVLLWCSVFICSLVILYHLNEKRVMALNPEWKKENKKTGSGLLVAPEHSGKKILFEALDWIDALVQAVFMVLLIQIFIFQLYVIPSESMVPSFLIKDRVVVTKALSGPKFPLSNVGLPCARKYRRGEVVVFRNPHYSMDRKSEVRSVVSQIVYMLTFTKVNLNVDKNGEPKADPLVKRVCGVPGEQLLMQDGTLYARTAASDEFMPVEKDSKFAVWNLNSVSEPLKKRIQMLPFTQSQYDTMIAMEQERRNFDLSIAGVDSAAVSRSISSYCSAKPGDVEISMHEYMLFAGFIENTKTVLSCAGGYRWFDSVLCGWNKNVNFAGDLYAESNYKLNVMIKLCAARLYLRTARLLSAGKSDEQIMQDKMVLEMLEYASRLHFYVMILDQRNMPVFPACKEDGTPQYIPDGNYFMMGDNRFNSLDMRHSYEQKMVPLSAYDENSVEYYSNMAPQYVSRKRILGTAVYRFWPAGRMGAVKTN